MNNNLKKEIIFAVPGSKTFINDHFKNTRESFVNISITGSSCKLNCPHCKTHLLREMDSVTDPDAFEYFISKKMETNKLNGVLISGGFDDNGKLPLKKYLNSIKKIKSMHPALKIYAHVGFIDQDEAKEIKDSRIDCVLTNIISSQNAINSVYNLPYATPEDYYDTLKNLRKNKNRTAPHIIIGLDFGKIESEYEAVKQVAKIGADSLVFVVVKKLTKEINFADRNNYTLINNTTDENSNSRIIDENEIVSLISFARNLLPDIPITFGCAKPMVKKRGQLEIDLLNIGIDVIAFPSDESINYAISNKIPFRFKETCCAYI
ncbi:hypothetical protein LLG07_02740 [bacterium]|nr:hypothetical protein [bacterium]